ncbi:DUF6988 family protein [Caldimonas sp. KR1-144]|uniref:DUF6988 family protein n=1 Tax=Caldimonas sp. KR1-144 TaxID=3400911 RepID=UPI003BFD96C7
MDDKELEGSFWEQFDKARDLTKWVHGLLGRGLRIAPDPISCTAAALYGLGHRHFDSMLTILSTDLNLAGSAFALARPQLDAYVRAEWLMTADDPEAALKEFRSGDRLFTRPLANLAMAKRGAEYTKDLTQMLDTNLNLLHGLTHGGKEQIDSWYDGERLGPAYRFRDMMAMVDIGWRFALKCGMGVASCSTTPSWAQSLYEDATGRMPRLFNDVLAELGAKEPAK